MTWKTATMAFAGFVAWTAISVGVGILIGRHSQDDVTSPPPPAAGEVPVAVAPPVAHGDPALPKPDDHTEGVLRITVPADSARALSNSKPQEIFVYLDDDPKAPPRVRADVPVQVTFSPVVDPWLTLRPRLMAGGSGSPDGYVSPWAGLRVVQLFEKFNFGLGIDRSAVGVFAGYEFFREYNAGLMWNAIPLRDNPSRIGVLISYRF